MPIESVVKWSFSPWLTLVRSVAAPLVVGVCFFASKAAADHTNYTEYQVKGAFLYNFARFVDWNTDAGTAESFDIAILGHDPFGAQLDRSLRGRELDGKPIRIRRIRDLAQLENARLLFVSRSEAVTHKSVLAGLDRRCVLTVADFPGFARSGGVIEFFMKNQSVRFRVNLDAANRAGLRLRPNLLRLAEVVEGAELPAAIEEEDSP